MFYANLYSCSADPRTVDKTSSLTAIASSVPITPTAALDTMDPKIIIDYNPAYIAANYIQIPAFGKYYFTEPPTVEVGKRIIFRCTEDVLMSLKEYIGAIPATVIRSASAGVNYVPDNQLPVDPNRVDIFTALSNKSFGAASWSSTFFSYVMITGRGKN